MTEQVSIFDLTDEQIETAVAARRANRLPPRPDDVFWLAVLARTRRESERREALRISSMRRCQRCGIDINHTGLCVDCIDVLALEGFA
jgi:hypothetical protein